MRLLMGWELILLRLLISKTKKSFLQLWEVIKCDGTCWGSENILRAQVAIMASLRARKSRSLAAQKLSARYRWDKNAQHVAKLLFVSSLLFMFVDWQKRQIKRQQFAKKTDVRSTKTFAQLIWLFIFKKMMNHYSLTFFVSQESFWMCFDKIKKMF